MRDPAIWGEIRNRSGERLDVALHSGTTSRSPYVVVGHGLTATKDRPWLVQLAVVLATRGLNVVRFSFSGNGDSEGRFEEATLSKEVDDLGAVLDALPDAPVAYVGHSMGAAVGVLRASQDKRIRFLVSIAGMAHTAAFVDREFSKVVPDAGCMWEMPQYPLSRAFVADMRRIGTVQAHASHLKQPWLLVHGTADDVVPMTDSRDLQRAMHGCAELVEIDGADHIFSGEAAARMVAAVVPWLCDRIRA